MEEKEEKQEKEKEECFDSGQDLRLWVRPWIELSRSPAILRRRRMGRRGRRSIFTRGKTFDSVQDLESSPQDQWRYNQQQYLIFLHGHSSTDSRCALSSRMRRTRRSVSTLGQTSLNIVALQQAYST
jgi:hypothetical protein